MCFRGDLLLNAVSLNDMQTVTSPCNALTKLFLPTLAQVQKLVDEGCDVNFTTSIFPPLTIAANRLASLPLYFRLFLFVGVFF